MRTRHTNHTCAHSTLRIEIVVPSLLPTQVVMAMSQCKSKADWKDKLEEAGLLVPKDATLQYMKMIWAEAQQELKAKNLEGTLESEIKALRAAGRKKSVLLDFMKDKGRKSEATWEDMKKVLEENWLSIFGAPKVMKVDPAGPWMSQAATDYMDERNIEYISIPAEAHWTIGIVESTIKTFKGILTKLMGEFPNRSVDELVARAIWTGNDMDMIDGYTSAQRVFGRAPDDFGRFFKDQTEIPLHPSLVADGSFKEIQMLGE